MKIRLREEHEGQPAGAVLEFPDMDEDVQRRVVRLIDQEIADPVEPEPVASSPIVVPDHVPATAKEQEQADEVADEIREDIIALGGTPVGTTVPALHAELMALRQAGE